MITTILTMLTKHLKTMLKSMMMLMKIVFKMKTRQTLRLQTAQNQRLLQVVLLWPTERHMTQINSRTLMTQQRRQLQQSMIKIQHLLLMKQLNKTTQILLLMLIKKRQTLKTTRCIIIVMK